MKASPQKGGNGFVSAYRLIIGSNEARRLGFVKADGERVELEKTVDYETGVVTFRVARADDAR